jgi:hypothetical protein
MSRFLCASLLATICASSVLVSAQVTSSLTTTTSPVAYVYVSSAPTSTTGQINAYAASSTGALTPIPGTPFRRNVSYMALTSHWLFGVADQFTNIDSFSIAANGALALKATYNVTPPGPGVISVYLDHTGSTLYADFFTENNDYLSFSINKTTGQLKEIGDLPGGPGNGSPVNFIGNNLFAYSSSCYHFDQEIVGVHRASDGTLSYLTNFAPRFPVEKSGGFYCPWGAAADPTNHLAIAMQPLKITWASDGPVQLATYTVGANGNLSTNSTYENMPAVQTGGVYDYRMSPSGKYVAVGGTSGLQVFHFNGANPITKFTGLLTTAPITQLFWDNANHIYAISSTGKLFVFTISSTGGSQAPGSPHAITGPRNLIVLPK